MPYCIVEYRTDTQIVSVDIGVSEEACVKALVERAQADTEDALSPDDCARIEQEQVYTSGELVVAVCHAGSL